MTEYLQPTTSMLINVLLEVIAHAPSLRVCSAAAELIVSDCATNSWFIERKKDATEEALMAALNEIEDVTELVISTWNSSRGQRDDAVLQSALLEGKRRLESLVRQATPRRSAT